MRILRCPWKNLIRAVTGGWGTRCLLGRKEATWSREQSQGSAQTCPFPGGLDPSRQSNYFRQGGGNNPTGIHVKPFITSRAPVSQPSAHTPRRD